MEILKVKNDGGSFFTRVHGVVQHKIQLYETPSNQISSQSARCVFFKSTYTNMSHNEAR